MSFFILWLLPFRYVSFFPFLLLFYGIDRLCKFLISFPYWAFGICLSFLVFWVSMVSSSEVRIVCPSISLFAHLGASLGVSRSSPLIEGFVFENNSLSVLLVDLFPLLC